MPKRVTLDKLRTIILRLSAEEQMELLTFVEEQLGMPVERTPLRQGASAQERQREASHLLRALDAIAEGIGGEFDSEADARKAREERANRL